MENNSNPSKAGGPTPPPGLTEPLVTEPLAASGSLPRFTYRREGQCFVLTPDRHTKVELLGTVMVWGLAAVFLGKAAYIGADMIGTSGQGGHGSAVFGSAAFGAALVLLNFVPGAAILWFTVADLCFGRRLSVLDRGRGKFRIGARVVCGLRDIALLRLHRGHNPRAPENLDDARYFASFVLRNGRQVKLSFYSGKNQETMLGNGVAGAQIEAVMQAAAAFLEVEYALTGGQITGAGLARVVAPREGPF